MEGPFISKEKKGAHRLDLVRQDLDGGMSELEHTYGSLKETAIITIAPELPGCMQAIRYLSQQGIVVSLGTPNPSLLSSTVERSNVSFLQVTRVLISF